jgi:uncharacterized protein (TIGR00106 family)
MRQQVVAEISVVPVGTASPSISDHVAECLDILKAAQDIRFELTPMCTVLEGSLERVLEVARQMHEVPFQRGAQRVLTAIKVDERRDKPLTMKGKVEAVQKRRKSRKGAGYRPGSVSKE